MEDREEIEREAIDGIVYLVLSEIGTGDTELKKAVSARFEISDRAERDPALDAHGRERVRQYIEVLDDMLSRQYRELYRQGARDCVDVLRRLGVIK